MHSIRFIGLAMWLAAFAANAGDLNVTDGLALKGYDPVAFFREGKPLRGEDTLRFEHKGATYLFSSAAHRDAFVANPEVYLPQYGGFCAYGASRGYKADSDPAAFSVVDGKLYVNYNAQVREEWLKDPRRYILQADEKWSAVRATEKIHR